MKSKDAKQYIFTIIIILIALASMVTINFASFYRQSKDELLALGRSNLKQETEQLKYYLLKGMNVLEVTSISVEYMMKAGATKEEISDFLIDQSERYLVDVDENFTGIYGLFMDEYIDGIQWVPDDDYVPQEREWYIVAKEADGEPAIVPPYLDAQTNTIIISVCKLLYDGESVISLDIYLNEVQVMMMDVNMGDMGYGFIVDKSGLVVAHSEEIEKGKNYNDMPEMQDLMTRIYDDGKDTFDVTIDGEKCTVFTEVIMDDWYVVMVVSNTKLFHDTWALIVRNIIVCLVVFIIIVVLCAMLFRRLKWHMEMLEESRAEKERLNDVIIQTLARTIDAKDKYTNGHSQRVAKYAREIAIHMGKSESEIKEIYYAGLLHDVGKIHVPDSIINKPSKLTDEEFGYIKLHPIAGHHILKTLTENPSIAQGAKWHHERYDGKGYPNGLEGENIPEIARIIGVADAYDAMTSYRSYRDVLPQETVRKEIEKGMGTQFDPEIAKIMIQMIDEDVNYSLCQKIEFKKNVLIVDDEEMNVEFIKFALEDEPQYDIYSVKSGHEALEIISKVVIDIILLDIQMPDMDGFEVYKRLREKTDAPIVFMSVYKDFASIQKATDLGCDDYIVKPFLPKVLVEILHSVVQNIEAP
ncbi:MAG: response regulator [Clostridium sp.]|nr:response regulator [Clostridium sp.]MCM1170563.1 response regulator [Clostridium sp.]MCM1208725.1 response regulator [Ruminococcus sp.]